MSQRPQRAAVYEKQLTGIEQAVILAMLEIGDSTGEQLKIRIPRIAAWSKFNEKSVQRALWGDHRTHPGQPKPRGAKGKPEPECPFCKGLVQRRVLQQLSPANWKERLPAIYRLNVEILDDCEAVRYYLDQRRLNFPETKKPTVALDPASHGREAQRPTVAGSGVPRSGDPASHGRTDSKAFDSRATDSKAGGFKSARPAFSDLDPSKLLRNAAKELCERTAFPDTPSNVAVVVAAIKAIQRQTNTTNGEAAASLERCVQYVQSKNYPDLRVDRFFFEDAKYNLVHPVFLSSVRSQPSQEPAPTVCKTCAGEGRLHLQPHQPSVNGSRLIPCPDCSQMESRATA